MHSDILTASLLAPINGHVPINGRSKNRFPFKILLFMVFLLIHVSFFAIIFKRVTLSARSYYRVIISSFAHGLITTRYIRSTNRSEINGKYFSSFVSQPELLCRGPRAVNKVGHSNVGDGF